MIEKEYIGFYLFALLIPLPIPLIYSAIGLGLLVLNAILLSDKKLYKVNTWVLLGGLFVFIDLFRSIILENFSFKGFDETKMVFLIIPILFFSARKHILAQKKNILRFFTLGVLVYALYSIGFLFYFFIKYSKWYTFSFTDHYVIYVLYNYLPGAYHHGYIGIYIAFAIVILVEEIKEAKSNKLRRLILMLILSIIFCMHFYIGSKMTMIISILGLGFYLVFTITNKKRLQLILFSLLSGSAILFFAIKDWIMISVRNSIGHRIIYNLESLSLIKNNFWFGIGLKNIKKNQVIIDGELKNLIPHNLYIHDLLSNGILGFILIIFIFCYLYRKAIKSKDILFLTFIFMCFLLGFTEDFLYLQRGVFFFVFFASLFLNTKNIISEK